MIRKSRPGSLRFNSHLDGQKHTVDPMKTLLDGLSFAECPRWHNGRLYFTDRYTRRVVAVTTDGASETYARTAGLPAGLGFLPDGRLLITSMLDRRVLRREHDGTIVEHADLTAFAPGPLNDMLVDHEGRAWVGNFGFDLYAGAPSAPTVLISVAPDGEASAAAHNLCFPNGTVLSVDNRTLIVAETLANRLSAFTVSNGTLSDRRTWAAFGDPPTTTDVAQILETATVVPDGICLDDEGAVWVADVTRKRLIRVAEGGAILDDLPTNGLCAFACMLGGEDGRTLFACAAPTFDEAEAAAHHRAAILMTRVAVPHAGLP
jgi:sugar lactone lactonase YvrE